MRNKRDLHILVLANIVSGLSQGVVMIAVPWYFAHALGNSEMFGWIYTGATFGSLFWSLYAGTLIDKYPRKNIFLGINAVGFFIQAMVAAVGYMTEELPAWAVAVSFVFTMFTFNIHFPALYAFAQEISEKEHYVRTNSFLEITYQSMSVISGGLAAVLISGVREHTVPARIFSITFSPWKMEEIILWDSLTYLCAFFIVLNIRHTPSQRVRDVSGVWERIKTGQRFLSENPHIMWIGIASYILFVMLLIEVHQLLPVYIKQHLNGEGYLFAFSEMIYAIGAIAAGIWIRNTLKYYDVISVITFMLILSAILFVLCFVLKSSFYILLFSFMIGITNAGIRVLRVTWLFNHIPNYLIGRVNSVFNAVNILMRTILGMLFSYTFFNVKGNVRYAYLIAGVLIGIFAGILLYVGKNATKKGKITLNE